MLESLGVNHADHVRVGGSVRTAILHIVLERDGIVLSAVDARRQLDGVDDLVTLPVYTMQLEVSASLVIGGGAALHVTRDARSLSQTHFLA